MFDTENQNIPNSLTLIRILIIPIIVGSFYLENSVVAHQLGASLFALACITDFIDGYIARKYNQETNFGRMLDPIADKLLVGAVIIMLVKTGRASTIPCILILSREFFVAGLREFLAQIRVSVPVSRLAKIKTFIQMTAFTILILGSKGSGIIWLDSCGKISLWVAAILTIITGYSYIRESIKYF